MKPAIIVIAALACAVGGYAVADGASTVKRPVDVPHPLSHTSHKRHGSDDLRAIRRHHERQDRNAVRMVRRAKLPATLTEALRKVQRPPGARAAGSTQKLPIDWTFQHPKILRELEVSGARDAPWVVVYTSGPPVGWTDDDTRGCCGPNLWKYTAYYCPPSHWYNAAAAFIQAGFWWGYYHPPDRRGADELTRLGAWVGESGQNTGYLIADVNGWVPNARMWGICTDGPV